MYIFDKKKKKEEKEREMKEMKPKATKMNEDLFSEDDFEMIDSSQQYEVSLARQRYDTFFKRLTNSSSRERRIWNLIILIFVVYNAVSIPLKLCFRNLWNEQSFIGVLLSLDYLGDFLFVMDIILRFFVPYYSDGFLVTDKKRIALHYLKKSENGRFL